jgi:hypothetical protein
MRLACQALFFFELRAEEAVPETEEHGEIAIVCDSAVAATLIIVLFIVPPEPRALAKDNGVLEERTPRELDIRPSRGAAFSHGCPRLRAATEAALYFRSEAFSICAAHRSANCTTQF